MDLDRFKTGAEPAPPWTLGQILPGFTGRIISFDQSIRKVGWSEVDVTTIPSVHVNRTGMFRTMKLFTGHEDTLSSGELIFSQVMDLLVQSSPSIVLHEMPMVGGGRYARPDASLVAGMAIRCAAKIIGVPVVMVSANSVKNRLTGNPNADKAEVRAAVDKLQPEVAGLKPRNDDTYDSIAQALLGAEMEI